MSRLPWALLLLAVLAVPAATACSLSRSPVGPGYLWLHTADGELVQVIEVQDQSLGGDCSLANLVGLTERHLAWRDDGQIHVLDLETMDVDRIETPAGDALMLTLQGLVSKTFEWDGHTANSTWTLHRWDGSTAALPLPRSWAYLSWHDGEHAVIQTRPAARSNTTSWIHDLGTGEAVAGPFNESVVAGGRDWVVFSDGNRLLRKEGDGGGAAEGSYPTRITQDGVWTQEWDERGEVSRMTRLGWDGASSGPLSTQGDLLAATSTHVVTGVYALEWSSNPFDQFAAGPVGLSLGLLLLVLAARRR